MSCTPDEVRTAGFPPAPAAPQRRACKLKWRNKKPALWLQDAARSWFRPGRLPAQRRGAGASGTSLCRAGHSPWHVLGQSPLSPQPATQPPHPSCSSHWTACLPAAWGCRLLLGSVFHAHVGDGKGRPGPQHSREDPDSCGGVLTPIPTEGAQVGLSPGGNGSVAAALPARGKGGGEDALPGPPPLTHHPPPADSPGGRAAPAAWTGPGRSGIAGCVCQSLPSGGRSHVSSESLAPTVPGSPRR